MIVETIYDQVTATFTYIVIDEVTKHCGIIDSVLNYDQFAAKTTTQSADKVVEFIEQNALTNQWILETHVHADHITAAHYLQQRVGGKIAMSKGITQVLATWVPIFATFDDTPTDGSQFDVLFDEGDTFNIGELTVTVWHTPGHTPACASYLVENVVFVGDTLFAPNLGTARCDFPGGSAATLYNTIQRFYTLPDDTLCYLGHDYPKPEELPTSQVTIAESKSRNKQIQADTSLKDFVARRQARDATLDVPKLLLPSIQANMRNGQFGARDNQGRQFIKLPLNTF